MGETDVCAIVRLLIASHPNVAGKLENGIAVVGRGVEFLEQGAEGRAFRITTPAVITSNAGTANGDFQLVGYEVLINTEGAMVRSLNSAFAETRSLPEQIVEDCYQLGLYHHADSVSDFPRKLNLL